MKTIFFKLCKLFRIKFVDCPIDIGCNTPAVSLPGPDSMISLGVEGQDTMLGDMKLSMELGAVFSLRTMIALGLGIGVGVVNPKFTSRVVT